MGMKVTPSGGARFYDLGGSFGVVWWPTLDVDDDDLGVLVNVEADVEDHRLVITRLTVERRPGGPPVSIEDLKSMPMRGLIAAPAMEIAEFGGLARRESGSWTPLADEDLDALPELDRVALVYRAGYFVGWPPTTTVANTFGMTHALAAKRVHQARRAGLLEPTTKGKKGA